MNCSINRNCVPHPRLFLAPKVTTRRVRRPNENVQAAVLEAIADGQPIEVIASLIRGNIERLLPGAEVAVLRADAEGGMVAVAAPSSIAEHLAVVARWLPIAGREETAAPLPVELACGSFERRAGWAWLCKVSASAHIVLMILLPATRSFRPRERRSVETCLHLLRVAAVQDTVCRRLETTNHRLSAALNSISQGVCFFDGAGRLLLANPRYARFTASIPRRFSRE